MQIIVHFRTCLVRDKTKFNKLPVNSIHVHKAWRINKFSCEVKILFVCLCFY